MSPARSASKGRPCLCSRIGLVMRGEESVSKRVHVQATFNSKETDFLCEPRQSLLEVLRDELRLTGAKEGFNNGNCGACNVLLDGRLVNSCLVLGVEAQGKSIT